MNIVTSILDWPVYKTQFTTIKHILQQPNAQLIEAILKGQITYQLLLYLNPIPYN